MSEQPPAPDYKEDPDIAAVREMLHTLYAYTSDEANPPGEGRSWSHQQGRAALDRLASRLAETEARLEAAEGAIEFIEGHLELAEEWEPGESVISDANARRVISECLLAARRALAGKDAAA